MGVNILLSDVTQDKNNLKMLTNVLENLTGDVNYKGPSPTARIKPEEAEIEIYGSKSILNKYC